MFVQTVFTHCAQAAVTAVPVVLTWQFPPFLDPITLCTSGLWLLLTAVTHSHWTWLYSSNSSPQRWRSQINQQCFKTIFWFDLSTSPLRRLIMEYIYVQVCITAMLWKQQATGWFLKNLQQT